MKIELPGGQGTAILGYRVTETAVKTQHGGQRDLIWKVLSQLHSRVLACLHTPPPDTHTHTIK